MLTIDQKETILRKAGVAVPAFPIPRLARQDRDRDEGVRVPSEEREAHAAHKAAAAQWARTIETLYVEYVTARAAGSLRNAEEARLDGNRAG